MHLNYLDCLKSKNQEFLAIEGQRSDGLYMYYQDRYLYSCIPYEQYENSGYDATSRPWYQDALKGAGAIVVKPGDQYSELAKLTDEVLYEAKKLIMVVFMVSNH